MIDRVVIIELAGLTCSLIGLAVISRVRRELPCGNRSDGNDTIMIIIIFLFALIRFDSI